MCYNVGARGSQFGFNVIGHWRSHTFRRRWARLGRGGIVVLPVSEFVSVCSMGCIVANVAKVADLLHVRRGQQ